MANTKIHDLTALATAEAAAEFAVVTDVATTPLTKKITLANLLKSVVPYSGATGNVSLGNYGLSAASMTILAPAVSGREIMAKWGIADVTGTYVQLINTSATDATFTPSFQGWGDGTTTPINLTGACAAAQDSGASAMVSFRAKLMATDPVTGTASAVTTRPCFIWYNNTTELARISAAGKMGVGVAAPTAMLHLKAAAAAADSASLKIDAGVVATTPVSGNIESDGSHLYWTDSGGNRKQLDNA